MTLAWGDCCCDYDSPEFWRREDRSARKQYRCYECGGRIFPGDKYEYVCGKWNGFLSECRTCERCCSIRRWVQNNIPCFCWAHGNVDDDAWNAVEYAHNRAPAETVGLRFGLLRRLTERDRFNRARAEGLPSDSPAPTEGGRDG